MGIAYSRGNEYGGGLADKVDKGLTDIGYELVDRMNKLGILIDLAHAGDKTSLEVIEYSKYPVAITHAGARALWPSRRMKPDEVIQALAEKGGVFGIEAAPHTTITMKNPRHSLESVMEHFQYIEKLVGIDHVAFGPDTLFGDHVTLHKAFREFLSLSSVEENLPLFPRVEYVDGLENPSEFINIVRWLVKHGYSDQEITKVMGGNILDLLKRVWK
jgi:membrane dipeptidase